MNYLENDQSSQITPEEVADVLIKDMMETGRWEKIRVNLASILNVNRDYEKVKERTQEILSSSQMTLRMRQPTTTEYDIAETIEKQGGLEIYRNALFDLLNTDNPNRNEIRDEIYDMVEKYVLSQQS